MNELAGGTVRRPHARRLRGGDFEEIGKIVQLDIAAHLAELPRHRGGVIGDLRLVFHDSLQSCHNLNAARMRAKSLGQCEVVHTAGGFFAPAPDAAPHSAAGDRRAEKGNVAAILPRDRLGESGIIRCGKRGATARGE